MSGSAAIVLLVEDDDDIREALSQVLENAGYAVVTAPNGQVGLESLRVHHPSLILLDLMMPVMNGWQFRRHQRADEALAGVPVIVISADESARTEAAALGAEGFLPKPIVIDQLLQLVAQHCQASAADHASGGRSPPGH